MNSKTSSDAGLCAEWITDFSRFLALAPMWNSLAERSESPSVFLRHEWFDASWRWRSADCELRVLCVWKAGVLLGALPMVRRRARLHGLGVWLLEPLGVPDTQRFDLVVDAAHCPAIADCIVSALLERRREWDVLRFDKLLPGSAAVATLVASSNAGGFSARLVEGDDNPSVALTGTWSDYYAKRSRRLKKANNYVANLLKRSGKAIDMQQTTAASAPSEVDAALQAAIEVSARSWKQSTSLTLDHTGPRAFIQCLTEHARRNGWLSIFVLRIDGHPAAVEYQLAYSGEIAALRADYDPEWEALSPGSFLSWRLLETLFGRGFSAYRMGPGRNEYKFRWADDLPSQQTLQIVNRSWRGRWVGACTQLRRRLSAMRNRPRPGQGGPKQESGE